MQVHGHQESDGAFRYTEQKFKTVTIEGAGAPTVAAAAMDISLTRAPRPVSLYFEIPIDRLDLQGRTIASSYSKYSTLTTTRRLLLTCFTFGFRNSDNCVSVAFRVWQVHERTVRVDLKQVRGCQGTSFSGPLFALRRGRSQTLP